MEAEVAGAFEEPPPLYDLKEDMVMIFWRMIEVHVKWGAYMLLSSALCGVTAALVLGGIPTFVVEVVLDVFDLRVPWDFDLEFFYLACFALGVLMGLPLVAEHMVEGYLREIQPLRDEKEKRWAAKTWPKK